MDRLHIKGALKKASMKRRSFLKRGLAGSVLLSNFPYHLYAGSKKKYIHDRVILGNTGLSVSRMAMGTGTSGFGGGSNQTRKLGIKGLSDLLHAAYDEGINFWDSADGYGSHDHIKAALKRIPREKVVILTKSTSRNARDMEKDIDRFRREMQTDYIDVVLLHAVTNSNWRNDYKGAMHVLAKAKSDGIIRAHGISCHSISALREAANEPWVDVDLARFNPAGIKMDDDVATVRKILKKMKSDQKGIIGMKVFGAGSLTNRIDECLQFQLGHEFIDGFTLGIESYEQLTDIQKRLPEASVRG